jgi:hypothetical protein
MIFMTFISMHSVIICVVLPWRTYEMHPTLSCKSGCDIHHKEGSHRSDEGVTPQVLPWLEPTLALKAVITCGRDLREHIRTLEVLC